MFLHFTFGMVRNGRNFFHFWPQHGLYPDEMNQLLCDVVAWCVFVAVIYTTVSHAFDDDNDKKGSSGEASSTQHHALSLPLLLLTVLLILITLQ